MLLPFSAPHPTSTRLPPWLPSSPPDSCSHCSRLLCLPNALPRPHGSKIRPSKSDNAGSGSTVARQLIPIVNCFKQIKGNRIWTEVRREMKPGGGGGGGEAVCTAGYSYLALSPILTLCMACAWITDEACTSCSTGSPLFKPL